MTDEEKAEKYADWFWGASPSTQRAIKQAFLAGLKAGKDMAEADLATIAYMHGAERYKPKWHDLRKNPDDLPKRGEYFTNIGLLYYEELCNRHFWHTPICEACDYSDEVEEDEVIAWCEIPKYKE